MVTKRKELVGVDAILVLGGDNSLILKTVFFLNDKGTRSKELQTRVNKTFLITKSIGEIKWDS